jgi:hypothetical protein
MNQARARAHYSTTTAVITDGSGNISSSSGGGVGGGGGLGSSTHRHPFFLPFVPYEASLPRVLARLGKGLAATLLALYLLDLALVFLSAFGVTVCVRSPWSCALLLTSHYLCVNVTTHHHHHHQCHHHSSSSTTSPRHHQPLPPATAIINTTTTVT